MTSIAAAMNVIINRSTVALVYSRRFYVIDYIFLAVLVHGQVTIIFVVSVGLSVCLFVCLFVCLCRVFLSRL